MKPTKGERCFKDFSGPLHAYVLVTQATARVEMARSLVAGLKPAERKLILASLHGDVSHSLGRGSMPKQHLENRLDKSAARWCDVNAKEFEYKAVQAVGFTRKASLDVKDADQHLASAIASLTRAGAAASRCAGTVAELCGMAWSAKRLREIRRGPAPKK